MPLPVVKRILFHCCILFLLPALSPSLVKEQVRLFTSGLS